MNTLTHIASLIVQHRAEDAGLVDRCLAGREDAELALREGGRSVILCEADSESGLLDIVDALHALPCVYAVNLVHHHAEDAKTLDEEICR